uniref:Uncharacterized protein n=1 Tax=Amphimedon queenslandica TaxID=400682 RepID=A0A1X7UFC3_AMPQE
MISLEPENNYVVPIYKAANISMDTHVMMMAFFKTLSCLLFLLLSPSLSMAALPSEAQMREAGNRLSEKFRQLRTNGLGVDYMKDQYQSASVQYSTVEEDTSLLYDDIFLAANPERLVSHHLNRVLNHDYVASADTSSPIPNCCSNDAHCCYNCDAANNSIARSLYSQISSRRHFSVSSVEIQLGLKDGELIEFPRVSSNSTENCPSIDPRLTTWYTRATNVSAAPRYIVLFLNLNGASNATILKEAAMKLIMSLTDSDMISVLIVNSDRQRLCPTSFSHVTESQKWILSGIIENELLGTIPRSYSSAFQMVQGLFAAACDSNCSNSTKKLLIMLTNSSLDDFDGARFSNNTDFTIIPYALHVISNSSSLGPSYNNVLDIGNYYTPFIMSGSVSTSNILSSDFNSQGVLCLTLSRNIILSDMFRGVLTMRMPWQQLFIGIEMSVVDRPSSYYMVLQGNGRIMYHSRYPTTYVYDIDPTTIENNEAFPTILSAILNGQNESLPFNNTLLYSNNNQSYFTRTVPSTYYCWEVLDDLLFLSTSRSSPLLNVFACLVLADEDQSIVDTFREFDISDSYSQRSVPIYQDLLDDSSTDSCTEYCQYTSRNSLTLQLTTPLTPPTSSRTFQEYISGSMNSSYDDEASGIAEAVSVHSRVERVWLRYSYPSIIRRYLTTPTGIFLSYRGLQLSDEFDPKGLPSYISAITNDNVLSLTPAFTDPLFPELGTLLYSISESVRLSIGDRNPLFSVLSADVSMSSLKGDVETSLWSRFCGVSNRECTVITSDGYFVLLPNTVTSPLHITEHSDYDGITLSMINNGALVKTGCNNINDFSISHDRFYYVNISSPGCYITDFGCRDFCIHSISGTTGYLIVSSLKSTCLTSASSQCRAGQTLCQFCDTFTNSLECPCTCRTSACNNTTYNLPVCPMKLAPVTYRRAARNPVIRDNVMSCPQTCANQNRLLIVSLQFLINISLKIQ